MKWDNYGYHLPIYQFFLLGKLRPSSQTFIFPRGTIRESSGYHKQIIRESLGNIPNRYPIGTSYVLLSSPQALAQHQHNISITPAQLQHTISIDSSHIPNTYLLYTQYIPLGISKPSAHLYSVSQVYFGHIQGMEQVLIPPIGGQGVGFTPQ